MPAIRPITVALLLATTTAPAQSLSFAVTQSWGSGFQSSMTIQNTTASAISGWTVSFAWPHAISSLWEGQVTGPVGGRYTVTNAPWNGAIPAGGSVTFGFTAAPNGSVGDPTDGCLNGQGVPINGSASGYACGSASPPPSGPPAAPVPPNRSGKRIIGYFAAWGIYARNYHVPDVPADRVTHINYAFANISPAGTIALGDPYADIDKFYPGDCWDPGCLRGNFNRLKILKEQHPHVQTLISVGGWTWSGLFSDVALTPQSRALFAQSCVDFMVQYGFDGVDIDWEYPVGGGLPSNITRPEDKQNFTLLLAELRTRLDARELIDGREYLLTIAAPCDPAKMANIEIALIHPYLDWINLLSYDFHGSWSALTNFNSPLYASTNDPTPDPVVATQWNTHSSVQGYLAAGVPADKIVPGVAFYGRGWHGVPNTNDGLYQPFTGIPTGTWEPGVFDYEDIEANYLPTYGQHTHPEALVPWIYDPSTGIMISYDDPASIGVKADYINAHGLGGAMFWEFSGDNASHDLLQALQGKLLDPAPYIQAGTTGSGTGDLLLHVWALPDAASHVLLVGSATPAPAGVGTGPLFGLVPDALTQAFLATPAAPQDLIHFPVAASPYSAGPLALPPGTLAALSGQSWELFAAAYDLQLGFLGASGIVPLLW